MMVRADSERIGRVLTNLISNAVKYAPGSAEIKIELQDETAFVKVSVTDKDQESAKKRSRCSLTATTRLITSVHNTPDWVLACSSVRTSSVNTMEKLGWIASPVRAAHFGLLWRNRS
jgi:hypothetical protein